MRDVHVHLERGPYTAEWADRFVDAARARGVGTLYFLEHSHRFAEFAPMYEGVCARSAYQRDWFARRSGLPLARYTEFMAAMRKRRFPIEVRFGLEVCYFPEGETLVRDVTRRCNFDFLTGAIHWIDGWGFDHRPEFWEGVDVDAAFRRYDELMLRLVESGLFTGLAHPDSIKCFGHAPSYDPAPAYDRLAAALVDAGMYAEQSGGLALNYGHPELGMGPMLLEAMLRHGVALYTASDAHRPEDAGANIRVLSDRIGLQKRRREGAPAGRRV